MFRMNAGHPPSSPLDSTYSWLRLSIVLLISTLGSAGKKATKVLFRPADNLNPFFENTHAPILR